MFTRNNLVKNLTLKSFDILRFATEIFELELPQIHPVFHTNLLSLSEIDLLPGRKLEP